ncbi:MAG: hypothetical protein HY709_04470 [Candidatus Latescibacteria bacterium]|nr:hypothetical protein [Candidatus Latescibacterota bacterium]
MHIFLLVLGVLLLGMSVVLTAFCRSRLTIVSGRMNGVAQEIRREISSGDKELGRAIKKLDAATREMQERLDAIIANVVRLADRITGLEKEATSHRWW